MVLCERIPGERPVDRRGACRVACHRRDHAVGVGDEAAKGFSTRMLSAVRRDALDLVRVLGGRRAEDGEVGLRLGRHFSRSVKTRSSGMPKLAIAAAMRGAVGIADADDLGVGMLGRFPQQVAHVQVIEADAEDAEFRHRPPASLRALPPASPRAAKNSEASAKIKGGVEVAQAEKRTATDAELRHHVSGMDRKWRTRQDLNL